MRYPILQSFTFLLLFACFIAAVEAKRVQLKPGDVAPKWTKLPGVDGKEHGLSDLKEAKAIVVVFTCESCPVAKSYEARLSQLVSDFKDKGLVLVAINANKDADLKTMKAYAHKKKFPYAYVRDETQKVAKSFGAKCTPEAFLLDKGRRIAYLGAIDDDRKLSGKAKRQYLRDAITAVLKGEKPPTSRTRAVGCTIRWK